MCLLWCGGCCGVSMLLRDGDDWDCLINLGAFDYPLIAKEDLIHTFSSLQRDFSFIDHTRITGWKE
ncbi:putative glycosyl transferase, family 14, beta-glucuronosyltransferase GlcAT14A/B/C [Helianthus annuus]|nr:putative glycosyl transferase, family 14, beta-glucuronosyltransferase GlcAT14A/B/C [Helianthus annuus]KAJ0467804.1 putative glycosyl transferase, family 14 [Helianthus annuus]